MPTRERQVGEFCWINVLTPEPDRARAFFTDLLEWSYLEIPGMGHRVQVGGNDIGAFFDVNGPQVPPGTPAGIGVMVRVESADDTAARAAALGGSGKPGFDVGPQGRMAECYDPFGANIDVWQPYASTGMTTIGTEHGAPSWFELFTPDPEKAATFYGDLFGWTAMKRDYPGIEYTTFDLPGEVHVGGMMRLTPEMGPMPTHWGVYFTVRDVHATVARALELGGSVSYPVMEIPTVGRFGGVASPEGVHFSVIQYPM
jgi:predicted enzyme related to lactoylglutathione lyase